MTVGPEGSRGDSRPPTPSTTSGDTQGLSRQFLEAWPPKGSRQILDHPLHNLGVWMNDKQRECSVSSQKQALFSSMILEFGVQEAAVKAGGLLPAQIRLVADRKKCSSIIVPASKEGNAYRCEEEAKAAVAILQNKKFQYHRTSIEKDCSNRAFDELLDQAGGLGRFQIVQLVLFCVINILTYPHIVLENFTAAIPDHRCWVQILDNDTVSGNVTRTLSQDALLRISIPLDSNLKPDKCRRFIHPQWQLLHLNETVTNTAEADTEPCVDGWVYDRSYFPSTIITEWDLVCESQSLKSVVQTLFMTGSLLGSLIYSLLSDRFGRKVVYLWCLLQLGIADTAAAFAPTFLIYCILRFWAGLSVMTIMINAFCLMSEWTTSKRKSVGIVLMMSSYSIGQMFLGGLAFAIRSWHTLHLAMSVPLLVLLLPSRKLVESFRWLIVRNQLEKGVKELRRVAHINGKKNAEETLTIEFVKSTIQKELDAVEVKPSIFQLFHAPKVIMRTCCLCLFRFSHAVSFYGLILNLQHLGSNIFLFQVLFGAITLTARFVSLWTLKYMGRRTNQTLFSFLAGVSILVNTFLPQEMQTLRVSLATLGVGSVSAAGTGFTLHQIELLPTVFRSTLSGIVSGFQRTGAILAPLLMTLLGYSLRLPWIIYGVIILFAGLVILPLPETRNQPLVNTLQDVENNAKYSRKVKQEDTSTKVTQF
ncbi:solute carrier family 22 member 9-like [Ictidomys tridecemlineatus]|nr:solute carrier family 22 member 9-like [Ictidomys tridecemlineatus]